MIDIDIGIYITIITIIIGAYLTYNRQLKIKSFEYFFERRKEILNDIEKYLKQLYMIREELAEQKNTINLRKYYRNSLYEGLMLYHKIKSANFGNSVNDINKMFKSIIAEKIEEKIKNRDDFNDWIERKINILSPLFNFAYGNLNHEIEMLTLPYHKKLFKIIKKYKQKKSDNAIKLDKVHDINVEK